MVFESKTLLAQAAGAPQGNFLVEMLPFLLMLGVIYLLILRPMGRQEKERKKRIGALKKGDHVVLGGGILGRISNWDDPKVAVIEIADKVKVRVLKKDIADSQEAALAEEAGKDKASSKDKTKDKPAPEASKPVPSAGSST